MAVAPGGDDLRRHRKKSTSRSQARLPGLCIAGLRSLGAPAPFGPGTVRGSHYSYDCVSQGVLWDSVSSPALAKNVIAVGATESYRPTPEPSLSCGGCFVSGTQTSNGRPPDVNATHVGRVASFSGRGRFFGPLPGQALAHNTRIKPDLVAPGVRVFSTVPYSFSGYDQQALVTGCSKYYSQPNPGNTYHTYGTGTSFAAPVVSGAAALKRKWFLDRGVNSAPSLLKAALIATADSLADDPGSGHRRQCCARAQQRAAVFLHLCVQPVGALAACHVKDTAERGNSL